MRLPPDHTGFLERCEPCRSSCAVNRSACGRASRSWWR